MNKNQLQETGGDLSSRNNSTIEEQLKNKNKSNSLPSQGDAVSSSEGDQRQTKEYNVDSQIHF